MNAGAKEIAPSAVGLYVCNVLPSFLTKLTGPIGSLVTYKKRFQVAAICMIVAFALLPSVSC